MRRWAPALFLIIGALLVGCSSTPDAPAPSPSPTGARRFDTVADLKDQVLVYGYPCPEWVQDDRVTLAASSGSCSYDDVLMVFDDPGSLQAQLATYEAFDEAAGTGQDRALLVGPNWIINGGRGNLALLAANLGGELISRAATVPPAPPSPTAEPTFSPDDWKLEIRILEKKCYGSAGCSITFRITPSFLGAEPLPDTGTVEVTYEVTGGEDGPQINTFTVEGGVATYDAEERISTASQHDELSVTVTEVTWSGAS